MLLDQLVMGGSDLPSSSSDPADQSSHAAAPEAHLGKSSPVTEIFFAFVGIVVIVTALHWLEDKVWRKGKRDAGGK